MTTDSQKNKWKFEAPAAGAPIEKEVMENPSGGAIVMTAKIISLCNVITNRLSASSRN